MARKTKSAERTIVPFKKGAKPDPKFDPAALPQLSTEHHAAVLEKIKTVWTPRHAPETEIKSSNYPHSFLMPVVYAALRKMKNLGAISYAEYATLVQHHIHIAQPDRIAVIREIEEEYGAAGLYLLVVNTLEFVLARDATCLSVDDFDRFQASGFLPKQTQSVADFEEATKKPLARKMRKFSKNLARKGSSTDPILRKMEADILAAGGQPKRSLPQVNPVGSRKEDIESTDGMPGSTEKKKQRGVNTRPARDEATKPTKRIPSRKNKLGWTIYLKREQAENFRAIAAAKGTNAQAYVEQVIAEAVEKNANLIEVGKKKLAEGPVRRRSTAEALEHEVQQLRAQLKKAPSPG